MRQEGLCHSFTIGRGRPIVADEDVRTPRAAAAPILVAQTSQDKN
jgi:hypothetical protein